jgi:hypothetical protein
MEYVIAICGFGGAWLLVFGPLWQARIELREEEIDQEAIQAVRESIKPPPKISAWWWLLPPVAYLLNSRRQREIRRAFNAALPPEALKQTITFMNKANGWVIVALGGYLIAAKETWELIQDLHWSDWVFWVLVVVLPIAAIANTAFKGNDSEKLLHPDEQHGRRPKATSKP